MSGLGLSHRVVALLTGRREPGRRADRRRMRSIEYLPERGRPGLVPGTRELVALWPYVIVYRIAVKRV